MHSHGGAINNDVLAAGLLAVLMKLYVRARRTDTAIGDLTGAQYSMMRMLALSDGLRVTDLARAEGVAVPTASVAVRRLLKQGLVTRSNIVGDARSTLVSLTDRGRAALFAATSANSRYFVSAISSLTDAELRELAEATGVLARLVDPGDDESNVELTAALWETCHDG